MLFAAGYGQFNFLQQIIYWHLIISKLLVQKSKSGYGELYW